MPPLHASPPFIRSAALRRNLRRYQSIRPTQATRFNEVWSWDFIPDRTANGASLKMLTLINEDRRQCLRIRVGRMLKSRDVLDALAEAMEQRGVPAHIRSDDGPEPERSGDSPPQVARRASEARQFIATEVHDWLREMGIATIYTDPGSPWRTGHVGSSGVRWTGAAGDALRRSATGGAHQSFHHGLRDECLNREMFLSVAEARVVIEEWRRFCNRAHAHSRLGFQSPDDFATSVEQPEPSLGT